MSLLCPRARDDATSVAPYKYLFLRKREARYSGSESGESVDDSKKKRVPTRVRDNLARKRGLAIRFQKNFNIWDTLIQNPNSSGS